MTDFLDVALPEEELNGISTLALAHIGDCVYELLVRTYLLRRGEHTNRKMHEATLAFVSAPAQARAMDKILPLLTEEERAVWKRGRNSYVNSVPKNASVADYHAATGLEALFGWLYLRGERSRAGELFALITEN